MNEEYLWNRTGEPDPAVVALENVLGQLGYAGSGKGPGVKRPRRPHAARWLAAAVLLAGLLDGWMLLRRPASNWRLADGRRLRPGQTIETGARNATVQSEEMGEVTIDPGSRFRLLQSSPREQRFDLQIGTIHALIWAPPGQFIVDTPSSKTVDLGCRYTLQVASGGTGLITVELGWVAFEWHGVESFIPAGAACVTRPGQGPGTPYFGDAPEALTDALARFDTTTDASALEIAMAAARRRDALSLWHLMVRTRGAQRGKVYDRLSALVTMPAEATRDAVVEGDSNAIAAVWNSLDLGNTDWWRKWKRPW
jgi:hypothetical protein